jgi:hypothetical protein
VGGTYGDPKWPTRNAAVGDLNGDGYPDIAVANREMTPYVCYNDGKLHFKCNPLRDTPSAASIVIADIDRDGLNDVIFPGRDDCQSRVFFNRNLAGEGQPWGPAKASIRAIAVADLNAMVIPTSPLVRRDSVVSSTSTMAKVILGRAFSSRNRTRWS